MQNIGTIAYFYAKNNIKYRQRFPGSSGNLYALNDIIQILNQNNINYYVDEFINQTPIGNIKFRNLIVDIKCINSPEYYIIGCHHDSKYFPYYNTFQGANDGASGVGLLLALILYFNNERKYLNKNLKFIFFDGQQCFLQYNDMDGLYGSKNAANKYCKNCLGMINLDMIGAKDLNIQFPKNSNIYYVKMVKELIKNNQFYKKYFNFQQLNYVVDDTVPFEEYNIKTINFIDMKYKFWHTQEDTINKISPTSLNIIGDIVIKLIRFL